MKLRRINKNCKLVTNIIRHNGEWICTLALDVPFWVNQRYRKPLRRARCRVIEPSIIALSGDEEDVKAALLMLSRQLQRWI